MTMMVCVWCVVCGVWRVACSGILQAGCEERAAREPLAAGGVQPNSVPPQAALAPTAPDTGGVRVWCVGES